ncbi:MAG: sensor domain-containing protein [Mycobacterium sp.]
MRVRTLACCAAAALLVSGCSRFVDGLAVPNFSEPPPGVIDADEVLLSPEQMQAITGAGEDLTIIPSMDGKSPVDIEAMAEAVPQDCRFVFAETLTFGPELEDFHKTSFQSPANGALISQGAASYRDIAAAGRAFEELTAAIKLCAKGSMGEMLIGDWQAGPALASMRPGTCGREYRLKSTVLVEVTYCAFPRSVPATVMTNILNRIPG